MPNCHYCGAPLPVGRTKWCSSRCAQKAKYWEARKQGICYVCQKRPATITGLCEDCYHKDRQRKQSKIEQKREQGLCIFGNCSQPTYKAGLCKGHYERHLESAKQTQGAYYRRKNPAVKKKKGIWSKKTIMEALQKHFAYIPTHTEYTRLQKDSFELPSVATMIHYFGPGGFRKAFQDAGIKEKD